MQVKKALLYHHKEKLPKFMFDGSLLFTTSHLSSDDSNLVLDDCEFTGNVAVDFGGAIEVRGSSTLQLTGCVIQGNLAAPKSGRAAINVRPGAFLSMGDSFACENVPTQLEGDWFDAGGNVLCLCPADLNDDGLVDGFDLTILLANWGPCADPLACEGADLNFDGLVDGEDLLIILSAWGLCP